MASTSKIVSKLFLLLITLCIASCQPGAGNAQCSYKFAYVNFTGQEVELSYANKNLFSGIITDGHEATGINFVRDVYIEQPGELELKVGDTSFSVQISEPCKYNVVYVQPYKPMLLVTDHGIPLLD